MRNPDPNTQANQQPVPRSLWRGLLPSLLLVFFALQSPAALAQHRHDHDRHHHHGHYDRFYQERPTWISGGVGDEEFSNMRRAAARYNVHVLFSGHRGAYRADVPFNIRDRHGAEIYAGISDGPLLYLRVPPGNYRIAARLDGRWQTKRIYVGANATDVRFVSTRDRHHDHD